MKSGDESDVVVLPPGLLAEVNAAAEEEHRSTADILQDAVAGYLRTKRWERTLAYGQARAQEHGFSADDVSRLIAESRAEERGRGG